MKSYTTMEHKMRIRSLSAPVIPPSTASPPPQDGFSAAYSPTPWAPGFPLPASTQQLLWSSTLWRPGMCSGKIGVRLPAASPCGAWRQHHRAFRGWLRLPWGSSIQDLGVAVILVGGEPGTCWGVCMCIPSRRPCPGCLGGSALAQPKTKGVPH